MQEEQGRKIIGYIAIPILFAWLLNLCPLPAGYLKSLQDGALTSGATPSEFQAVSIQMAASYFPWRGDLWEKAGEDYLAAGNAQKAIQAFQEAASLNDLTNQGWMLFGDALFRTGKSLEAIKTWIVSSKGGETVEEVYPRLIHAYVLLGDYTSAIQLYRSWNGWTQTSADDLFQIGLQLALSDPDQTLKLFVQVANLDPQLGPNIRIISTAMNAGSTDDPAAYRLLLIGKALGSIDRWDLAVQAFHQACVSSPDYAEAWAFLGEAQEQTGGDGLAAFDKALTLNPNSTFIQALQGLYWQNHGKPEVALIYLHAVAAQEPDNGIWQVELGNTLAKLGDLASALVYYQSAVVIEPENAAYWRDLAAFSFSYNTQIDEVGLPAARQAVALDPANPDGLDILGQYMLNGKDLSSAERMFLKSVESNPQNALVQFHLGMTYLEEGKMDSAFQVLELAANLAQGQPLEEQIKRVLEVNFP